MNFTPTSRRSMQIINETAQYLRLWREDCEEEEEEEEEERADEGGGGVRGMNP